MMNFKNNKNIIITFLLLAIVFFFGGYRVLRRGIPQETPPLQQEESQQQEENQQQDPQQDFQQPRDEEEETPSLTLKNTKGENISLEGFIGTPTVLSFWVSWSEDSINQLNVMENIKRLVEKDAIFLGIHATTFETLSEEELREYLEEKQYSFEILLDEEGEVNIQYYIGNFPTTIFLDHEGRVVQSYTTLIEEDSILEELEILLWEQQSHN